MKIVRLIYLAGLLLPALASAGGNLPVPPAHAIELISGSAGLYRDTPPVLEPPSNYKEKRYYRGWALLGYRKSADELPDEAADRLNYEHAIEQERLRSAYRSSLGRYEPYYGYEIWSEYSYPPMSRDYWW